MNSDVTRSQLQGVPSNLPAVTLTESGLPKTVPIEHTTGESAAPPGFILDRELGKGGMGVVSLAHQTGLNRPVAIKMLLGTSTNASIRFLAEAQAIAAVRHPNIVEVYQFGTHNNQPFIAMEYCTGGTLAERLKSHGKFKPKEAAELMTLIADGVEAAHAQGIVHRDLKPGNVLIGSSGEPKVCDFGLAKLGSASDLTETGAIIGTPAYMPPEQARGDTKFMLPAGDVWALGVILYEMVTGQRPFAADDHWGLLNAIIEGRFDQPRTLDGTLPKDLELIILKCLRAEPQERYASAGKLAEDLRNWLAGRAIVARPPGSIELAIKLVKRNPAVSTAFLIASLAMFVGTGVSLWQANVAQTEASLARLAEKQAEEARIEAEKQQGLTRQEKAKAESELDRAERLLYAANIQRAQQLWNEGDAVSAFGYLDSCRTEYRGWEHDYLHTEFNHGYVSLAGHSTGVNSVSFSPDGKRLVSGGGDNTIKIWDAITAQELLVLQGHTDQVKSVLYSLDGMQIVSGSKDKTVKVWDAITGQERLTLNGHTDEVLSVLFSPDGKKICSASGSLERSIQVWDASTGHKQVEIPDDALEAFFQVPTSLSFSPDGKRIVAGDLLNGIAVWDAATGKRQLTLAGHTVSVNCVSFSPDGNRIASGSGDHMVKIWDAITGQNLLTLKGHSAAVFSLSFSPDGKRIVSGGYDKLVKIWDVVSGEALFTLKGHMDSVSSVSFSPDGNRIVTGSRDNTIKIWDAVNGQEQCTLGKQQHYIGSYSFSPDAKRIVLGTNNQVVVIDAASGREYLSIQIDTDNIGKDRLGDSINQVLFSSDGAQVLTLVDNRIRIWDAFSGQEQLIPKGNLENVAGVTFSPDSKRIVSWSNDKTAKVWDTVSGQEVFTLKGDKERLSCVSFSPDGKRIASGSDDHTVKIWDALSGLEQFTLNGHTTAISCLSFSPDSKQIVTGGHADSLIVWDSVTGQKQFQFNVFSAWVMSVSFSPDGKRIAAGIWGHGLKLWDAHTGHEVLTLKPKWNIDDFTGVSFGPDGKRAYSLSRGTIRIWDASFSMSQPEEWEAEQKRRLREWAKPNPTWHAKQAMESEQNQQWFAAKFHLKKLVELNQFDPTLPIRLALAEANWVKQAQESPKAKSGWIPLAD